MMCLCVLFNSLSLSLSLCVLTRRTKCNYLTALDAVCVLVFESTKDERSKEEKAPNRQQKYCAVSLFAQLARRKRSVLLIYMMKLLHSIEKAEQDGSKHSATASFGPIKAVSE